MKAGLTIMNTTTSRAAQLARAARIPASTYNPAWENGSCVHLVPDSYGLAALTASDVIDIGGENVGIHVEFALESLSDLGMDVTAEDDFLQLTGSREEIAKAAALFSEIGAKLAAHAEGVTTAGAK